MKKIITSLFAVFVIGFILWAMLYQSGSLGGGTKVEPGEKAAVPEKEQTWTTLAPSTATLYYSAVGTVRSREEIDIISRLITARVTQVNFRSGDSFKSGDVLIRLEDKDLQAKVDGARENLKGAESRRQFAEAEYARSAKLIESDAIARRAYEEAVSNLNVAKAQVAMMNHELENAETNLDYATIKAPFDGIVAERNVDEGDLATPLNPLMKLFNPSKLQLRVPVRENLLGKIKIGDMLEVFVESTGKRYSAEVKEVIPSVDPGSRTFIVNACLSGDTTGLMPGMFARCEVPVGEKEILAVPMSAVHKIGQLEYLTVRANDGKAVRQLIKTAPIVGKNDLEILSGATSGEKYLE